MKRFVLSLNVALKGYCPTHDQYLRDCIVDTFGRVVDGYNLEFNDGYCQKEVGDEPCADDWQVVAEEWPIENVDNPEDKDYVTKHVI